jgi:hypothetical protein
MIVELGFSFDRATKPIEKSMKARLQKPDSNLVQPRLPVSDFQLEEGKATHE